MSSEKLLDDLTRQIAAVTLDLSTSCAGYQALLECILTGRATIGDATAVAAVALKTQRDWVHCVPAIVRC